MVYDTYMCSGVQRSRTLNKAGRVSSSGYHLGIGKTVNIINITLLLGAITWV